MGTNAFALIHPADLEGAQSAFARCLAGKTGWEGMRIRLACPDGSAPWVETSGVAHLDRRGEVVGFTATTRRLHPDEVREVERATCRQRAQRVLDSRGLTTVWQPIFSPAEGTIIGAEALSRLSPPLEAGPDRWFSDAAEVGLGLEMEMLAIEKALEAAPSIPDHLYLSLNASPATVASGQVLTAVGNSSIAAERIVIELTEHVSVEDYNGLIEPLDDLRSKGLRLAVDDAGAGFASFRHILRLSPELIKLDQSIVQGITSNPAQRALATALILFALDAGPMIVVAEGVETAADLSTIRALGFDGAQGYYLARPAEATQIDWASTRSPGGDPQVHGQADTGQRRQHPEQRAGQPAGHPRPEGAPDEGAQGQTARRRPDDATGEGEGRRRGDRGCTHQDVLEGVGPGDVAIDGDQQQGQGHHAGSRPEVTVV